MSIPQIYNDFLTGGVFVEKNEAIERATWLAKGIMEHDYKRKGRTEEQVFKHSLRGVICELGIKQATKGSLNDQKFNYKDRSTHGFDVTGLNHKLEVKLHKDKYFSFYPENIKTMLNNIAESTFDYIATASFQKDEDSGYTVYPRLVINPKTFRKYATKSRYGADKPMWYNHHAAVKDGECIVLNNGIISRLQVEWNML